MPRWVMFAVDLAAITVLTAGIYFPRYGRRDLLASYVAVNVGVMAVTEALSDSAIGTGVGLGLFGVLSIVRLRSAELAQQEVAYYFASLALGLLGGFAVSPDWLGPALVVAILVAVFVADHPGLAPRYRHHVITLDRAFTDERELVAHLETALAGTVRHLQVTRIDLVRDTTVVDVRYRLHALPVERPGYGDRPGRAGRP